MRRARRVRKPNPSRPAKRGIWTPEALRMATCASARALIRSSCVVCNSETTWVASRHLMNRLTGRNVFSSDKTKPFLLGKKGSYVAFWPTPSCWARWGFAHFAQLPTFLKMSNDGSTMIYFVLAKQQIRFHSSASHSLLKKAPYND